jgi:tetratricopeptide (TPR) repeat protein
MKKIFTISMIMLSLLIVLGGCATKKYTKKGLKLEAMGQYSEAADMFYQAVTIKNTNLEAMAGLKRCGQMTLSKKLSDFNQAYNNEQNKEAVYYYQDAKAYYNKMNAVGCELNFPSFYEEYYNEAKDTYLEDKYYEASKLLDEERFPESETILREIVKIQPNYKDVKDKLVVAVNEPKYREGLRLMDAGLYRKSYFIFDGIIQAAGAYKSSYDLKSECLSKGTMTISVEPIKNYSSTTGIEGVLQSKIISGIQAANNPFIKLIDSQEGGKSFQSSTINPVKTIVPNALLNVEITKFSYNKGQLQEFEKRGYLRKKVKVLNRETGEYETKTEYDKVIYKEYKMSRTVDMTVTYKLVNGKTGEIYKTSSKTIQTRDDINYARYTGDATNLVPGYWKDIKTASPEDYITDRPEAIRELNNMLNARSQIKDYNTLSGEANDGTASEISNAVIDFVNQN